MAKIGNYKDFGFGIQSHTEACTLSLRSRGFYKTLIEQTYDKKINSPVSSDANALTLSK